MPAKAPNISGKAADKLVALGKQIRAQRKAMQINATTLAEAAGMSRITLHRIENGEASVTMGAYLNVITALNLDFGIIENGGSGLPADDRKGMIPARILLADYPELKKLAWQVSVEALTPFEALSIYKRNWRHLEVDALAPLEQQLIEALQLGLGEKIDGNV